MQKYCTALYVFEAENFYSWMLFRITTNKYHVLSFLDILILSLSSVDS